MEKMNIDLSKYKCALFDLDGVVFDTESQYTVFWHQECMRYRSDIPGLEHRIKGMALTEIFETYFKEFEAEWSEIVKRLDAFEAGMRFVYVDGFEGFIRRIKAMGMKTAVVTSSNREKMKSVYRQRPEVLELFDVIMTAEDFSFSKPDPDCYLKGMDRFGCSAEVTMVFEDSINGLKAGRGSGAFVVGLATTNPADVVAQYSDVVISSYPSDVA